MGTLRFRPCALTALLGSTACTGARLVVVEADATSSSTAGTSAVAQEASGAPSDPPPEEVPGRLDLGVPGDDGGPPTQTTLSVLEATEDGFELRHELALDDDAAQILTADFDGDGLRDAILLRERGPAQLHYGGDRFQFPEVLDAVDLTIGAAGDLNGDGWPDLVGRSADTDRQSGVFYTVYFGGSDQTFEVSRDYEGPSIGPGSTQRVSLARLMPDDRETAVMVTEGGFANIGDFHLSVLHLGAAGPSQFDALLPESDRDGAVLTHAFDSGALLVVGSYGLPYRVTPDEQPTWRTTFWRVDGSMPSNLVAGATARARGTEVVFLAEGSDACYQPEPRLHVLEFDPAGERLTVTQAFDLPRPLVAIRAREDGDRVAYLDAAGVAISPVVQPEPELAIDHNLVQALDGAWADVNDDGDRDFIVLGRGRGRETDGRRPARRVARHCPPPG